MSTTVSADGTKIGYTRTGQGPALVLVDGAMCFRGSSPNDALAKELSPHFTVYTYDRRGRGESDDTQPYAVEREIEDLAAVIKEAGGEAGLFGISSGAALVLAAVQHGLPAPKLAIYEPPFVVDDTRKRVPADYQARMEAALAAGKRGTMVKAFMSEGVGLSPLVVATMRIMPFWSKLKRVAHTIPYDTTIMGETQSGRPLPDGAWSGITAPVLVLDGGKSPDWMRNGVAAAARALPTSTHRTLAGQTHLVKAEALAPALRDFFQQ